MATRSQHQKAKISDPAMLAPVLAQLEGIVLGLEFIVVELVKCLSVEDIEYLRKTLDRKNSSYLMHTLPEDIYKASGMVAGQLVSTTEFRDAAFQELIRSFRSYTFLPKE